MRTLHLRRGNSFSPCLICGDSNRNGDWTAKIETFVDPDSVLGKGNYTTCNRFTDWLNLIDNPCIHFTKDKCILGGKVRPFCREFLSEIPKTAGVYPAGLFPSVFGAISSETYFVTCPECIAQILKDSGANT